MTTELRSARPGSPACAPAKERAERAGKQAVESVNEAVRGKRAAKPAREDQPAERLKKQGRGKGKVSGLLDQVRDADPLLSLLTDALRRLGGAA